LLGIGRLRMYLEVTKDVMDVSQFHLVMFISRTRCHDALLRESQ